MSKYCSKCGEELDDKNQSYCPNCGEKIPKDINSSQKDNTKLIYGLVIVVIILVISIAIITQGFGLLGEQTSINLITKSPVSNSGEFTVQLMGNTQAVAGKTIEITFKNNQNAYTFNQVTDSQGLAPITLNVEPGDYDVTCTFAGDGNYAKTSTTNKVTVESKVTEINSQVTSTRTEPDYQSFSYSRSFEDTDKNGDGYVYLSDMNIAHTPKNIQNKMFADSDSDGDGRLNHDEYYKFMYKLNYDKSSYGL